MTSNREVKWQKKEMKRNERHLKYIVYCSYRLLYWHTLNYSQHTDDSRNNELMWGGRRWEKDIKWKREIRYRERRRGQVKDKMVSWWIEVGWGVNADLRYGQADRSRNRAGRLHLTSKHDVTWPALCMEMFRGQLLFFESTLSKKRHVKLSSLPNRWQYVLSALAKARGQIMSLLGLKDDQFILISAGLYIKILCDLLITKF